MSAQNLFINGEWRAASGQPFQSINPFDGSVNWEANEATAEEVDQAVDAARAAFKTWSKQSMEDRIAVCRKFAELLKESTEEMALSIAKETGKPLWESRTEIGAMVGKIEISVKANASRTGTTEGEGPAGRTRLTHRPHGVVAVFGPYNFPGHLPNGHIVPALIAGNTVVFKPSEQTPMTAEITLKIWEKAGLPAGVINLVQGAKDTGIALSTHKGIDGLFFTGSANTGKILSKIFADQPGKILALELGGNNPLIVDDVADIKGAIHHIIFSAFVSAGQRCTCARRLYVPAGAKGDELLNKLVAAVKAIKVGKWDDEDQPFMGPLVSKEAAQHILDAQDNLIKLGGKSMLKVESLNDHGAMLSPGIIDVTDIAELPDDEYFGPLLSVIRYTDFNDAIEMANNTRYGLSSGLLSDSEAKYQQFYTEARAGIVNWNKPLTGASSAAPFGGIGDSGNHRASAFYAADYCAFPMASVEADTTVMPGTLSPGLTID